MVDICRGWRLVDRHSPTGGFLLVHSTYIYMLSSYNHIKIPYINITLGIELRVAPSRLANMTDFKYTYYTSQGLDTTWHFKHL